MSKHYKPQEKPAENYTDSDSWDDPVDLDRPDLPLFPVDALPGILGEWVRAAAHAYQVPAELPGLLALAACAGIVARRVEIEPGRGWREPINLYVAVLLDPASRKSAVFRDAFAPIRLIELELIEREGPAIAGLLSDRRCREKQLGELERKSSRGDDQAKAEARDLAAALAAEPALAMPKLLLDDATSEAVENQLVAQGGRLVVAGAEGGLFDVMAGRYSGGASNLDVFLKGHAGDDLRVDRVIRGSLMVDRCCLTLAYAVQPQVIRGMAGNKAFRGRGLIGRFLYGLPKSSIGNRLIDPDPIPVELADCYEELIRRLAEIKAAGSQPRLLKLAKPAATKFLAWASEVELMLGDAGSMVDMPDWGGKLCGLSARLAAVIHLANCDDSEPWRVPIPKTIIESALMIARWAIPHAQAVIGLMAADDGRLDDATYCLRFIRSRAEPQVSRRDIHSHGRSRFDTDSDRLDRALDVLIDRGWLRPIETENRPGRPSVRFMVHPKAIERDRGVI